MANSGHDNIIPPVKGEVRNPNGRPVGSKNRATILKKYMDLPISNIPALAKLAGGLPEGCTIEDAINIALIREAAKGDVAAVKEVHDTLHGKITDKVQTEHSFKQMGKITMSNGEGDKKAELSFNVGAPAESPENANDET